jgi:hypothetical protein
MLRTIKKLSLTTAAILAVSTSSIAMADNHGMHKSKMDASNDAMVKAKSTSKTITTAPAPTSIMMYDLNGDGMLSRVEIGNKLFYQFDTDGNESLDNIEWNKNMTITMAPVEKITVTKMDVDGDGVDEQETVDVEVMMKATGLERFDNDGNGLSPREFTGKSVLQLDLDKSGLIEMREWRKAYMDMDAPLNANNAIYNNGD